MPLGRLVERAYGSNKGVWFRKKPQRAGSAGAYSGDDDDDNAVDGGFEEPPTAAATLSEETKQRDGEKGELKDRDSTGQDGPVSSKGQTNDEDWSVDGDDDDSHQEEEEEETDSGWFGGLLSAAKPEKRSYGAQKRKRVAVAPMPTIVAEPTAKKRARGADAASKTNQNTLFLPSPFVGTPAYKSIVCAALNSVSKFTPMLPVPSRPQDTPAGGGVATDESSRASSASSGDDKKELAAKSKKVAVKKPSRSSRNPDLAGTAFDPVQVVSQPSSKTSVDSARAFFQRLDSTQTLTLDASQSPGKPTVRTRYMVSTDSQELQDEYEEYVQASSGTGVVPLSLQEYANNRSAYFRTKDMYDGFLDG
jgi:hypothetical protein